MRNHKNQGALRIELSYSAKHPQLKPDVVAAVQPKLDWWAGSVGVSLQFWKMWVKIDTKPEALTR